MNKQLFSSLSVLLIVVILSGCRTYGDYGTEQASFDQIEAANQQFAQDLERARGELETLKSAAGRDADLRNAVTQYEALLAKHEEMSMAHKELAAGLEVKTGPIARLGNSYRDLNRALGNVAAEQLQMENHYRDFAASLIKDAGQRAHVEFEQSRYMVAPPYYEQIRFALAERSISDALDVRAGS